MKAILVGWAYLPLALLVWCIGVLASGGRMKLFGPNLALGILAALVIAATAFIMGYSKWSPVAGETLGWFFIPIIGHSVLLSPSAVLLFVAARKRGEPTLVPTLVLCVLLPCIVFLFI